MSYIYNSQDNRLDFPNPYRVENLFYFAAAMLLVLGGLLLLVNGRAALGAHSIFALAPLAMGVFLLVRGLIFGALAMGRLRFFFGRGQPASLADDVSPDQVGTSKTANTLKALLRHNSLTFAEPTGPLNGALYSLIPNLIYAPYRIQLVAQRQFQNALAILVTLASLGVSLVGAPPTAVGWLGGFYFGMVLFLLLKPIETGAYGKTSLGFGGLVGLILLAILGPVGVPILTHGTAAPEWLPGMGQAALLLLLSEIAIGLFFLAVINQTLKSPPQANMAVVQGTLTMNSHPKQLLDELERRMQEQWVASLPNRCYSRVIPEVLLNAQSGSFEGELLEETQPVPRGETKSLSLARCFSEPRYRWLGWLNVYAVAIMATSVFALFDFAMTFGNTDVRASTIPMGLLGASLLILGGFSFRAGNALWGRFDFVSKIIWVEMKGNYQAAQMDYGNQFTDRIKTQKHVINIESMTLRTWVVEVETVAFGKDSERSLLGMRGLSEEASALHQHLTSFGQTQSMIVAPTSEVDLQRANALGVMNRLGGAKSAVMEALPGNIAQAIQTAAADPVPTMSEGSLPAPATDSPSTFSDACPNCKTTTDTKSNFCPECGARLAPA
jgi:hypothetical protein